MIAFIIFYTFFAITNAYYEGFCGTDRVLCNEQWGSNIKSKYILYDVNPPEGFNLRRDVYMRFAIMLAEAQKNHSREDWRLILMPWNNMYHWKSETSGSKSLPWRHFFDLNSFQTYAPVVELEDVLTNTKSKHIKVDHLYVLQNFENPFENGVFEEKWHVVGKCDYDVRNDKITIKETICVKFQGKISKLWEVIALNSKDKNVMFAHGEIPLHNHYGDKTYWACRKSMRFNEALVEAATKYMIDKLNCDSDICGSYISVHWRRQDFARSRSKDVPSLKGTVKQIDEFIRKRNLDLNEVFISTDAEESELLYLKSELNDLGYVVHYYTPTLEEMERYKDGGVAIIEQIICSHSIQFIGTYESTFTYRIQEERELNGMRSYSTFNRLCPDKGKCEKPSVWKYID